MPKLSIITVTYNAASDLSATAENLQLQTAMAEIEWIIVDGGSKDGTLEIINTYPNLIKGWISEPDKGIYDAMNKGLNMANGDWVMFLNSGDVLESPYTLEKILAQLNGHDLVYGDTRVIDKDFNPVGMRHFVPPQQLSWRSFQKGMVVCHQAIIARKEIVPEYDAGFRIAGDIDWAIRLTKNSKSSYFLGFITTRFKQDGASTRYRFTGIKERFQVMARYYGLLPTIWNNFILGLRYLLSMRWLQNVRTKERSN